MLTSRERVQRTLNHQEPDLVPLDLGGSVLTGMHVDAVYRLRQALGLDEPGTPVKVIDPYQMLGEIKLDLADRLGADIVRLGNPRTMFGFRNENWKPWTTFAGTPVLVPGGFNTELEPNGDLLLYPEGDKSAPPSGIMPADGFYFDAIVRQPPIDDANLNVEDNVEEFRPISAADLEYYAAQAERLYTQTDKAILGDFGGTAFGDIAMVPAAWLKHPRGIRDVAEWYMSAITRRDYVYAIFERQCEIGLEESRQDLRGRGREGDGAAGDGHGFRHAECAFISPQTYCDLYQPFHKQVNDWVHAHTGWKTFIHTDGA